ncbi:MAG TPA: pantoate--beta-alanine ligase [Phycisphaerae bacterium]|nr:pantoate--beta-alanine ligase [Phycisphaerae bacterium]HNU46121.1 pantoate--beta-alanine ligase [Phycisphaerae bacterium]
MLTVSEIPQCREVVVEAQRAGNRVGLVPTMGALHAGHLSLVEQARRDCRMVAVSIFVNPTQFGPQEDFAAYPRPIEADLAACRAAGVDLVFAPPAETMYPAGHVTTVRVERLTNRLCGAHRPGHFDGVATVVAKLFQILPADSAYFGEKDYQQLVVIRRMATDLDLPIRVVGCPTVREPDGLARSSRNVYLSASQRQQALCLSRALFTAVEEVAHGQRDGALLIERMRKLIEAAGAGRIDYIDIVDPETLEPMAVVDRAARACLAVWIGKCRLIDNVALAPPASGR